MLRRGYLAALLFLMGAGYCWQFSRANEDPVVREDASAPVLQVLEQEICGKSFAVTGSGAIWTFVPEGPPRFHEGKRVSATQPLFLGYDDDLLSIYKPPARNRIAFFSDGKWQVVKWTEPLSRRDRNGPYGRIVAGVDNTVLVVGNDKALLIRGVEVIDHGEIFGLLKKHREIITQSFGLGVPYPIRRDRWRRHTMVISDKQGRIWCLHNEGLHVLMGDQWIDCRESLVEAGSRRGAIAFMVPGPDHNYLFIGDNKLRHDGGVSLIAQVDRNGVAFQPTHHAIESMGQYPAIRDRNQAIWIASPEGRSGGVSDIHTGQSAVRVDQRGKVVNIVRMSGYPLLSDPNGNTWLGGIRGGPEDQFNIVRDGVIIQRVKAPVRLGETSHNRDYMPMFCDANGSVFVHTDRGLAHFVADKQPPHHYRFTMYYALDTKLSFPQAYSVQGFCISLVADDDVPLKRMYLMKVPK